MSPANSFWLVAEIPPLQYSSQNMPTSLAIESTEYSLCLQIMAIDMSLYSLLAQILGTRQRRFILGPS